MIDKVIIKILNYLIKLYSFIDYYRFISSTKKIKTTQHDLKANILSSYNIGNNGFNLTNTINCYDDIKEHLDFINPSNRLIKDKVIFFEKTSGSTSQSKSIPYTKKLIASFNKYFRLCCYDILVNHRIKLETGVIFISVSPFDNVCSSDENMNDKYNNTSLQNDSDYLEKGFVNNIIKSYILLPPKNLLNKGVDEFRRGLANLLLENEKLEIISIWSPTYLLAIIDYISSNKQLFINNNKISNVRQQFIDHDNYQNIWPYLKLISCWKFGASRLYVDRLKKIFPNVVFHEKGILATEAPISVVIKDKYHLPYITGTYFEFRDLKNCNIYTIEQLKQGNEYEVIITQQSGLFRYGMGDVIKVSGYYNQCPLFVFIGRVSDTCDMVGEKITKLHAQQIRDKFFNLNDFMMLVPYSNGKISYYVLLVDKMNEGNNKLIAEQVEQFLCSNIHYHNARVLAQLEPVMLISVDDPIKLLQDFYYSNYLSIGDMKDTILINNVILGTKFINYVNRLHLGLDRYEVEFRSQKYSNNSVA